MSELPLEDHAGDVVGKAMRGLHVTERGLAEQSGVGEETVRALVRSGTDAVAARAVAPWLGLDGGALAELAAGGYRPGRVEVDGLAQFTTPFGAMTVNAYLAWDRETGEAVAFDTGGDIGPMLGFARGRGLRVGTLLGTHGHGDHIFELDRMREKTGAAVFAGDQERVAGAEAFEAGREFECGRLRIGTRLTWGHSPGGISYVIDGLSRPVAVCGDAVFAGSMGGGTVSYADALRTGREELFSLPDEAVLCPGHGPMTTVGEERRHNPFFANGPRA
jgi:glyoxylase-like metal-dependent hydrolase (beta-lactamase superfamily II)